MPLRKGQYPTFMRSFSYKPQMCVSEKTIMLVLAPPTKNLLCSYTNSTSRIQILRISDIPGHFFERSVMPHDTVLFEAPSESHLEIHSSEMMGSILSDAIPCSHLAKSCDIRKRLSGIIQQAA